MQIFHNLAYYGDNEKFKSDDSVSYFKTSIPLWSLSYWTITTDNYERMNKSFCNPSKDNNIQVSITMTREASAAESAFGYTNQFKLTKEQKQGICDSINGKQNNKSIPIIPLFYMMPALDSVELEQVGKAMVELVPSVTMNKNNGLPFWDFRTNSSININYNKSLNNVTDEVVVYIASPLVPKDNIFAALSGLGIIGIYTGVVIVLYNVIKSNYSGLSHVIMFENMPDCLALLQL